MKVSERKKDLRSVKESDELRIASNKNPNNVAEVDLSYNQIEYVHPFLLNPLTSVVRLVVSKTSPISRS